MRTRIILCLLSTSWTINVLAAENLPSIEFGGRIQADATYFDNDKYSYQDGSEVRRLRGYVQGNLTENWEYRVQYDFAPDDPESKDVYLRYTGLENTLISLGHFKVFPSLEEMTSSNNMTFTERALPNALVKNRRIALGYQHWSDSYTIQGAIYEHEANNLDRGTGINGRFAYRPSLGEGQLLHLGAAFALDEDDDDTVRFRTRPESHQDDHRIVDSGSITGVEDYTTLVLEAAYVNGRFSAQGEYMRQDVDRRTAADVTVDGYYGYVSWFLTDDSRPYSNSNAAFGTLTPSSTAGAWEIGARYSNLDLNDGGIAGGEVDSISFAVNYYMTRDLRFQLNYIMADSDDVAGDDDPNALQLRLRFTF